jgi:hypothetical protein
MISNSADVFSKLERLKQIRKRQAFCPVAKHRVLASPLTVADDLSLKTMISSPDIYDRELSILIFEHCEFPDLATRPEYTDFIEAMSHFDKKVLLWAIFDATYKTLGEQEIVCPKCSEKFKDTILAKELVVEDTIKNLWKKPVPFQKDYVEYTYNIGDEEIGIDKFVFHLSIPTIKKHLDILRMIDAATVKDNMNNFGTLMSKTEELSLITTSISVYFYADKVNEQEIEKDEAVSMEIAELKTAREVHKLIGTYIPLDNVRDIVEVFNNEYGSLDPDFKKIMVCPSCDHNFEFKVDMEVALFKSFLGVGST